MTTWTSIHPPDRVRCPEQDPRTVRTSAYPSAVDSHRSSFGSSISLRLSPSGNDSNTITSGSVADGALITSSSVLSVVRGLAIWAVDGELVPSPTPPPPAATVASALSALAPGDAISSQKGKLGWRCTRNGKADENEAMRSPGPGSGSVTILCIQLC
jgi:hypothetical protein